MKKFIAIFCTFFAMNSTVFAEFPDTKIYDVSMTKDGGNNFIKNRWNLNNSSKNNKNIKREYTFNESTNEIPDIEVSENNGIYVIKINTKKVGDLFKPYYVSSLKTNKEVFDETNARLVVNAGFFDPKNHQTVSYLTLNGNLILDPHNNKSLIENKYLKPYMDKILNRSELRVLKSRFDDSILYDIAPHDEPAPAGYTILHAIQGGPALAPILRLEEEFFVLTDAEGKIISQSASSLSKYARTLVGIKNNDVYFVIATNSHPISLIEASEIMKKAGFKKAMAFDGGGSVSVDFRDTNLHIISDKNETARKLKSFWLVMPNLNKTDNHKKYITE